MSLRRLMVNLTDEEYRAAAGLAGAQGMKLSAVWAWAFTRGVAAIAADLDEADAALMDQPQGGWVDMARDELGKRASLVAVMTRAWEMQNADADDE